MKKHLDVVVGLITNTDGQILIAKRQQGQHLAGYWEFPGGKIDAKETAADALLRELYEELDILVEPGASTFLFKVDYDYPEKTVCLNIYLVSDFQNTASGKEGQELRWVRKKDIQQFEFPPANKPIVEYIVNGH